MRLFLGWQVHDDEQVKVASFPLRSPGRRAEDVDRLRFAGLWPVLLGLAAGVALGSSRLLASQLYAVTPGDPATFTAGVAVILATAAAVCALPARGAARVFRRCDGSWRRIHRNLELAQVAPTELAKPDANTIAAKAITRALGFMRHRRQEQATTHRHRPGAGEADRRCPRRTDMDRVGGAGEGLDLLLHGAAGGCGQGGGMSRCRPPGRRRG